MNGADIHKVALILGHKDLSDLEFHSTIGCQNDLCPPRSTPDIVEAEVPQLLVQ